ncbi:MAG: tetratricopeptide repeat protein [Planctomycetota bacterium]|jgi:tetratricopeptide (TPR) repeat protein
MTKRKKSKGRKGKKSARSRAPASSSPKRTVRLLVAGIMLCAAIGVFYYIWTLSKPGKETKKVELPISSKEQPLPEPAVSTVTSEEEFTVLKQEEMALARQVLKDFPGSDDSYVLMGDLYSRHANSAEAFKFWETSLEINPNRFDVYRNMGLAALRTEEFDKAVEFGRKALEIRPDAAGVRSNIAKALMDSGKYSEAIAELEEEIKLSPKSVLAHFQLAEAYLQQREYDKAKKYYEETIKLQPNHSHAYHGLITVCARLKQVEKAKEYRATFKKLRSKQFYAYMGRQWDSIADLESLRKGVARTYLDAERIYRRSSDTAKAEELLKRASGLDPNNTRCLERLASLYFTTNRAIKALECFEKIAGIDPNNPVSYLNIGQVATTLKMYEKAEQAFRKTVALAPDNPVGYRELARFYLRTETKPAQAYSLAQKAITLDKKADTYFLLGWAADVNGDRTGAMKAMEQAIKLEPDNQKYRKIYERIRAGN